MRFSKIVERLSLLKNKQVISKEARFIFDGKAYTPSEFLQKKKVPTWAQEVQNAIAFWMSSETHLTQKTSGSTGEPKNISLPKSVLAHSANSTISFFQLEEKCKALLVLPAQFIGGKMMVFRALLGGWHLHLLQPKSALPELLSHFDFVALAPMQAENSLNKLNKFNKILLGGAPVSPTLESDMQNISSAIFHGYGMTETASHIALRAVNGKQKSKEYCAMPGVCFEQDARDCLVISARKWEVNQLATNDVVQLKGSDQFVWQGRADHIINSGGLKIFPEALEQKLATILPEFHYYISAVPDKKLGQKVVLVIEGNAAKNVDLSLFSGADRPREIVWVHELPRTENGKILRKSPAEF